MLRIILEHNEHINWIVVKLNFAKHGLAFWAVTAENIDLISLHLNIEIYNYKYFIYF